MGSGVVQLATSKAVRRQAVLPAAQVSIALTSDEVTCERSEPSMFFTNVSRRFTFGGTVSDGGAGNLRQATTPKSS
jgi:hypothetical protein